MDFGRLTITVYYLGGALALAYFVFIIVKLIFPDQQLLAAQARLGVDQASRQYRHWFLSLISPIVRAVKPRIQQIRMPIYRQKRKKDFIVAGVSDQFDADEFVAVKVVASVLAGFATSFFILQMGNQPNLSHFILGMLAGFFAPDFVIWDLRKKRQKQIIRDLPAVMDLLTLSVEAGMDFMAAISRVIEFSKDGALKDELSLVLKEIQLGTTRADALRNMADRVALTQLSSFASIFIQSDEMGSSVGPVLRAQSDLLRTQRFQTAEREGAKAAQKILMPLVICILPAVFIVIMGPVICDIVYNQTWFKSLFGG